MSYGISKNQVKYIQVMRRRVFGDDREAYLEMLWGVAKVRSCLDLTGPKIKLVIRHLEKCLGIRPPAPQDRRLHTRAPQPQGKPAPLKATALQVYEIRRLWGLYAEAADKERALRNWLQGRNWPASPEWLTLPQAQRVIEALKRMVLRVQARKSAHE